MISAVPWPSWDEAALAALASAGVVMVVRRARPTRWSASVSAAAWEFSFVASLYSIWRIARMVPIAREQGALERARTIARWQDRLFLPSEAALQEWVLGHDWLAWAASVYYATVHVPALIVFLVWMWVRHSDHYPTWRTALAVVNGLCLVIRFLRVAPPRLLPELGFVDLSRQTGISVYGPVGSGISDQFAAMPSIHVAWAAVVSFGVFAVTSSRWRWVMVAHVLVTILVVAATGHHWWLDGGVALALLGVALWVDQRGRRHGRRWRPPGVSSRGIGG